MNDWIIVSYYTIGTFYKDLAKRFVESLKKHKVYYYVEGVPNLNDWGRNTNYKPSFLLRMLEKFPDRSLVWIDCDAELLQYPTLFDSLDCDVAAHEFDRRLYQSRREDWPKELLSGTLFLRNNSLVQEIVKKWKQECEKSPQVWDQKSLEKVLNGDYHRLPASYCQIHRLMRVVKNPVIVHYQASRQVRKNHGKLIGSAPGSFPIGSS